MALDLLWLVLQLVAKLISVWAIVRVYGLAAGWWGWDNEKKEWINA